MISFAIITDGREPEKLHRQILSISQIKHLPESEIIISGELSTCNFDDFFSMPIPLHLVPMPHTAKQGRLGALRNGACQKAKGETLVVTDDDMEFDPDWYIAFQNTVELGWDLFSCRILNPDGTRYWDWKCHEDGMNWLLDYDKTDPRISLTGGLTIMKRHVFEKVKWNNDLGFNQAEDVDFSNRVKEAGFRIVFNKYATITHHGPYTQIGTGVHRL